MSFEFVVSFLFFIISYRKGLIVFRYTISSQKIVVEEFYCRNRLWILSVRYVFCLCRGFSTWYRIGYYSGNDIRQRFQVSCILPRTVAPR